MPAFSSPPTRLFKYVTFERIDVLQNECIRFTQPAALNDPWELKPYLESFITDEAVENEVLVLLLNEPLEDLLDEGFQEAWDELSPSEQAKFKGGFPMMRRMLFNRLKSRPHLVEEMFAETRTELKQTMEIANPRTAQMFTERLCKEFGILSLTSKPDNKLMWSHYAANHSGMVLELDTTQDFFTHRLTAIDSLSGPKPVVYADQFPTFPNLHDLTELAEKETAKVWGPLMFTKSDDWAYETEWRMVRYLKYADKTIDSVSPAIHLFNLPAECVDGVIMGAQMSRDNRRSLMDFFAVTHATPTPLFRNRSCRAERSCWRSSR